MERRLVQMQTDASKTIAHGKRTAEDVVAELNEQTTKIEASKGIEAALVAAITEAREAVKAAQIVDYREQAEAKAKELKRHQTKVAKVLQPIFENEDLAGLQIVGDKGETAKGRSLKGEMGHLENQARRLEAGLTLQPNIYEGLPEKEPDFQPVRKFSTTE